MNKDLQAKISQLSMMEQSMQQYNIQKQQFNSQLMEVESAQKELEHSKEQFKIIGNLMVAKNKTDLQKELSEKKEILNMRIESLEKQEDKLREKAQTLQKEVLDSMKESEKDKE